MRQLSGDRVDLDALDTPQTRRALLESMIDNRLVAAAAAKARLAISDDTLREAILGIPAFQEDGRFTRAAYEAVLRSQNPPLTPPQFEVQLRYELTLRQVSDAVTDSAIASRTVAARLAKLLEEKREVSEALVPAQPFMSQVKVDAAQAKAYYDSRQDQFRLPERMRVQYVVLSGDALAATEPVTEAELKQAYEANASRYKADEQRRASHILIQVAPDANEATRAAARKKAEEILAEVRKSPGSFAELAKKYSQDPGSADKGGDLGYFDRGMMGKPVADAVFALAKVGDISGVVKSDYGYHIIKLTGIQPGRTRTLDDVRKELTAELQKQKAARAYAEAAERFSNLVFEQADSLQAVAQRYKLKLQTTGWITKAADKAPPPLNNAKLINALFSDDVLVKKHNTPAVEVAPETMVAARVLEVARHPNADKLSVCKVDAGGQVLSIVCGAPNVRAAMVAPLARVGARLAGGEIKLVTMRGVQSQGDGEAAALGGRRAGQEERRARERGRRGCVKGECARGDGLGRVADAPACGDSGRRPMASTKRRIMGSWRWIRTPMSASGAAWSSSSQ